MSSASTEGRMPCVTPGCSGTCRPRARGAGKCGACRVREWRLRAGQVLEVTCACGCGAVFVPAIFGTRYLNEAHYQDHIHAQRRAATREGKVRRHPNTILIWQMRDEMDADGKKGLCIYCEASLPNGRTHICTSRECASLYNSDWKRGRAMLKRLAKEQAQQEGRP